MCVCVSVCVGVGLGEVLKVAVGARGREGKSHGEPYWLRTAPALNKL